MALNINYIKKSGMAVPFRWRKNTPTTIISAISSFFQLFVLQQMLQHD
jgi:hypothetical protein